VRVVHIITALSTGGAETMLSKLLEAQNNDVFDSIVISLTDRGTLADRIEAAGVTVHTIDLNVGRPTLGGFRKLRKLVREFNPDCMQGWMYHGNLAASLVRASLWNKTIPVLWNIRQSLYGLSNEKKMTAATIVFSRLFLSRVNAIVYNSYTSAEQHEEKVGYTKKNHIVIPNGFDCDIFKPSGDNKILFRREMGVDENSILVGTIARFHPMKDHGNFLTAAAHVLEKIPEAHFILSGPEVDEQNAFLIKKIKKLGLRDHCHLLGERQDINFIMAACDVIVTSSFYGEGFPNVIGEAMACGVPCVSTDIGDSARVIGNTGKIVPAKDSVALAEGIIEILSMPADARMFLGDRARNRILKHFTIEKIAKQYADLYTTICR
jgi:glycosyltransferase involved in cell wall biosynthesis